MRLCILITYLNIIGTASGKLFETPLVGPIYPLLWISIMYGKLRTGVPSNFSGSVYDRMFKASYENVPGEPWDTAETAYVSVVRHSLK